VRRHLPPLLRSNPPFRDFWTGQTISLVGDQVSLLAIPLLAALVLDASATQVAMLSAAALVPNLFFSVHFGAWTDRRPDRRKLMVGADIGRAVLLLTLPAAAALDLLSMAQLYIVAFATGTLSVAFMVAYNSVFVSLVERDEYIDASSLLNGSRALSLVGGNAIAGLLVCAFTAPFALLADALSFLGSALFVGRARGVEAPVEPPASRGGLGAGIRFIARTPLMRLSLGATATFNLFNSAFWALLVVFAVRTLGLGAGAIGGALALGAFGSVLGTVFTGRLSRRLGLGRTLLLGFVLGPAPLIIVPLTSGSTTLALVLLGVAEFFSGMGIMVIDVGLGALFAAIVPDRFRARVSGAYMLVNYGVRPVGAVGGGLLASAIDLQTTMWIAAVGGLGGALWLLPSPMRHLRSLPMPAEGVLPRPAPAIWPEPSASVPAMPVPPVPRGETAKEPALRA
jgi:MFS family permease